MPIRRATLLVFGAAVAILILIWLHSRSESAKSLNESSKTNSPTPLNGERSESVLTNLNSQATRSGRGSAVTFSETKEKQAEEGLATLNEDDIIFYGRLLDQFSNAVATTEVKFAVSYNNGQAAGVNRGTVTTDQGGNFTIQGYRGKSLSLFPTKSGYALASSNGGGIYSRLWPDSQRANPDPNNPVVIKMWKFQGAEALTAIDQRYHVEFTDSPLLFDLLTGSIVSAGGDIQVTVYRPPGIVSEQTLQEWGVQLSAVDGGLMEASVEQARITYEAPDDGYQRSANFIFSTNVPHKWSGGFHQMLFVKSRNGQVYTKVMLSMTINANPSDQMSISFRGVANASNSRNWEADPDTYKPR